MIAYKLLRVRKNGTYGPLFINRKQIIPIGEWLQAENHPTKNFKERMGWHVMKIPVAPHLSKKGRAWFEVEIDDYVEYKRPEYQGGIWFLANKMRLKRRL
jgi:hypothetical protein